MDYEAEDPFDVVMFGYQRDQVDEYLLIQNEQEQTRLDQSRRFSDIERQLTEALTDNAKLRSTIARLTEDLTINRPAVSSSARIHEMIRMAELEAAAIRQEADSYAELTRRQAREDANLAAAQRRQGETLTLAKPGKAKPPHKSVNGSKPAK